MSVIGTSAAAGVAQTAMQSQQVGRQQARDKTQSRTESKRVRELRDAHTLALEDGDETDTAASLRVDKHLPHHESPDQSQQGESHKHDESNAASDDVADASQQYIDADNIQPRSSQPGEGLYKHVDITA